jgi:hypothetical protein
MGCYVLLLALSVFGWGLHSKLSLYECSTGSQASAPIAKLLSEQERATDQQAQPTDTKPVQLHTVVLHVVSLPRPVEHSEPLRDVSVCKPVAFSFDGPSLLRPPPHSVA